MTQNLPHGIHIWEGGTHSDQQAPQLQDLL